MKISDRADHRKMLFIFGFNDIFDSNPNFNILNKSNFNDFLNAITVNAIMIGSSNQSYTTYFGGPHGKADKGEADVLMFATDNDDLNSLRENMYVEGTVMFEEIIGTETVDPHDYLKNIMREFLSSSLA